MAIDIGSKAIKTVGSAPDQTKQLGQLGVQGYRLHHAGFLEEMYSYGQFVPPVEAIFTISGPIKEGGQVQIGSSTGIKQ